MSAHLQTFNIFKDFNYSSGEILLFHNVALLIYSRQCQGPRLFTYIKGPKRL